MVDGRRRAVVEIRGGRPDAVKRWRLITAGKLAFRFLCEPAAIVVVGELLAQPVVPAAVGSNFVERNDLVRVSPLLAIRAVTAGAVRAKDLLTLVRPSFVDGIGIFGRLERQQIGLDVAKGFFFAVECGGAV